MTGFIQCRTITNHIECFKAAERTVTIGCVHEHHEAVPLCAAHAQHARDYNGVMRCSNCDMGPDGHDCKVRIVRDDPGADHTANGMMLVGQANGHTLNSGDTVTEPTELRESWS